MPVLLTSLIHFSDTLLVLFRNQFTHQGSQFSAILLFIYSNFPLGMWLVFVAGSKSQRRLLVILSLDCRIAGTVVVVVVARGCLTVLALGGWS